MASEKILNEKKQIVSEIVDKIKNSESVILFQYQGLTVSELTELRNKLKEVNSEVRVYKNTMLKLACDELNINIDDLLDGRTSYKKNKKKLLIIGIIISAIR